MGRLEPLFRKGKRNSKNVYEFLAAAIGIESKEF
jgi:hypothetical protein